MKNLDFQSPKGLVEEVLHHIDNSDTTTLLDVGAGNQEKTFNTIILGRQSVRRRNCKYATVKFYSI